jgi:Uncharacterized protein conserved in bacteria (DUF2330)
MSPRVLVGSLAVVALATGLASHRADACGAFFGKASGPHPPSLASEQVLLIYDAEQRHEHFIREVAFRGDGTPFGFVVPTPARPEVAKVANNPFGTLERAFPFYRAKRAADESRPAGKGAAAADARGGVTVLETKKIGSFTAFVLAATNEGGLKKWLDENGLVTTPETEGWLRHYVRRRFYYVAMRYDPPPDPPTGAAPATIRAETVRISFASPLPYYPYLEPLHPAANAREPRLLSLWLVANQSFVPAALESKGGERRWVLPLRAGHRNDDAGQTFRHVLEDMAALAPPKRLVVQTFQDQKTSRAGFGDIVFVPEKHAALDDERRAELRPLLALLDDSLEGAP